MKRNANVEGMGGTNNLPIKDRYDRLNQCLYQLEDLLKNMGVSSFSVGQNGRQVIWDSEADNTDQQALGAFCNEIAHLHTDLLGKKAQ